MIERRRKKHLTYGVRRALSLCLALALAALLLPAMLGVGTLRASAMDFSKLESGMNRWQYYFMRTVASISVKDAYDTGVLASITAGQAIYEGGMGGYPMSIIAQNHFGMRAFSSWDGMVYDEETRLLYASYGDVEALYGDAYARAHLWRAYETWDDGIYDHSALFLNSSRYAEVLAAEDYVEASYAIQSSGYAGNSTSYASTLIGVIERYNLDQLDNVKMDSNGVYGLIMNTSRVTLDAGATMTLQATAYPSPTTAISVTWKSDRPEVATVDQNGRVTAKQQGYTLITAEYNGREAACVVEVEANAYNLERSTPNIYSQPDTSSNVVGKLSPGQPVKVISKEIYTSSDGTEFYAVSASPGSISAGTPVNGYVKTSGLYIGDGLRLVVGTEQTVLYTNVGDSRTIPLTVYADELKDKPVTWASSDTDVVAVDQQGAIQCKKEGVAVISVTIDGKLVLTVTVYVGSAALETLVANASVNLREAPLANASVLGVISEGQEVKLVSDPGDGWYRILAVVGGRMMEGYAYSRYFDKAGSSTPPPTTPVPPVFGDGPTVTYQTGRVNVDDNLNVRDEASTSGKVVAKLKNNHEVVILETLNTSSSSYPKWYRIRFIYNGEQTFGYVAADFIVITGSITETVPGGGLSAVYGVEEQFITNIPPETTFATFRAQCSQTVRVYHADGSELSGGDILRTGDTVCVYNGSKLAYVRIAVVLGDVDGNGKVEVLDYLFIKRAVLGTYTLEGARLRAAIVTTGQSKLSATDYAFVKRAVLGTYNLA